MMFQFIKEEEQDSFDTNNRENVATKKRRRPKSSLDWSASEWWRMLGRLSAPDVANHDLKLFNRRFRVPYKIFIKIVDSYRSLYKVEECNCCGQRNPPLELKILGVLRYMGRGCTFDCVSELNGISDNSNRYFFHEFCEKFGSSQKPIYVDGLIIAIQYMIIIYQVASMIL